MEKAFYITNDRGGKFITDDKGMIMSFKNQNTNLIKDNNGNLVRTNESSLWFCTLSDPELIKRAEAHPKFGKEYQRVDKFPSINKVSRVKSMEIRNDIRNEVTEDVKSEVKKQLSDKMRRFAKLETKLFKKDGVPRADASELELNEFNELKKELEL